MAKLSLTKSGLQKERNNLKLYQRVLPSLDLKRMQLIAELNKAKKYLAALQQDVSRLEAQIAEQLPMLADTEIDLSGLVRVENVTLRQTNVVGVRLPVLHDEDVTFQETPYSLLAKPHWVDQLVDRLKQIAVLRLQLQVAEQRVQDLEHAVRRITQRVNLFEKVLIPNTKRNIKRIQIFLGDAERSAVVRSKLAKVINQKKRKALIREGAQA